MEMLLDLENANYSTNGNTVALPDGVSMRIVLPSAAPAQQVHEHRIIFYPDGSTTAARITLGRNGQGYEVSMDWLIGRVNIKETKHNAG